LDPAQREFAVEAARGKPAVEMVWWVSTAAGCSRSRPCNLVLVAAAVVAAEEGMEVRCFGDCHMDFSALAGEEVVVDRDCPAAADVEGIAVVVVVEEVQHYLASAERDLLSHRDR